MKTVFLLFQHGIYINVMIISRRDAEIIYFTNQKT